ncbi:hypothetical protein JW935_07940 [candidate division KSB1 bacterium]|nr:hypothetical protein [candidate division KSB1 bacterium]
MLEPSKEIEKIGEIVIIGLTDTILYDFISQLCQDVKKTDQGILFANIDVDEDLALFLYGIVIENNPEFFEWDLLANKMLGYVALFEWNDDAAFPAVQTMISFLEDRFNVPVTIAACVDQEPENIHTKLFRHSFPLSWKDKFRFYKPSEKITVKNVLLSMIDTLIENYP